MEDSQEKPGKKKLFGGGKLRGRLFSNASNEDETDKALASATKEKFALNEDVNAFLKPSKDKAEAMAATRAALAPKIDIASAQRYPGSKKVDPVTNGEYGVDTGSGFVKTPLYGPSKGRRREGLTVGFVRAAPAVIGYGGDEEETPTIELSRRRKRTDSSPMRKPVPGGGPAHLRHLSKDDNNVSYRSNSSTLVPETLTPQQRVQREQQSGVQRSLTQYGASRALRDRINPEANVHLTTQEPYDIEYRRPSPLQRVQTGLGENNEPKQPVNIKEYDSDASSSEGRENPFADRPPGIRESISAQVQHQMRAEEGQALHAAVRRRETFEEEEEPNRPSLSGTRSNTPPQLPPLSKEFSAASSKYSAFSASTESSYLQSVGSDDGTQVADNHSSAAPSLPVTEYTPLSAHFPQTRVSPPRDEADNRVGSSAGWYQTQSDPRSQRSDMLRATRPTLPNVQPTDGDTPSPFVSGQFTPGFQKTIAQQSPSYMPYTQDDKAEAGRPSIEGSWKPSPDVGYAASNLPPAVEPSQGLTTSGSMRDAFHQRQISRTPSPPADYDDDREASGDPLEDFAERVEHMRGQFRLMAERDRPKTTYPSSQWITASIWWFFRARSALESQIKQRSRMAQAGEVLPGELLTQPHVDLAKCWWIVEEILPTMPDVRSPEIVEAREKLTASVKSLTDSMSRNSAMPPYRSLIQGQDITIWEPYPPFPEEMSSIFRNDSINVSNSNGPPRQATPLEIMPLGDTKQSFCYGRVFGIGSVSAKGSPPDPNPIGCLISILRGRYDLQLSLAITTQNSAVRLILTPDGKQGLTWRDLRWSTKGTGFHLSLAHGYILSMSLSDSELRTLWGLYDYTTRLERTLYPIKSEQLVYEYTPKEVQFHDAKKEHAFPKERVKDCKACLFKRFVVKGEAFGARPIYDGFRLTVVSSPREKTLNHINLEIAGNTLLNYELAADAATNTPYIVLRFMQGEKQSMIYFSFSNLKDRDTFYFVLNSMQVEADEDIVAKIPISRLQIQQASSADMPIQNSDPLSSLQWKDLVVINRKLDIPLGAARAPSNSLRTIIRHNGGVFTNRLNLAPGELQVHLVPPGNSKSTEINPTICINRPPQNDFSASIDPRACPPGIPEVLYALLSQIPLAASLRSYSFPNLEALHKFQFGITGYSVKYDGVVQFFGSGRRKMGIGHRRIAVHGARIQLLVSESQGGMFAGGGGNAQTSYKLVAFWGSNAGEASNVQSLRLDVKSTDKFKREPQKDGYYGLRLEDAHVPDRLDEGTKFVTLDGEERATEEEDVIIGFDEEAERDVFAEALPAPVHVSRSITFKRRKDKDKDKDKEKE